MQENLTARQWQQRVLATRRRFQEERRRIWPDGERRNCPACGQHALMGRSDLVREVDADGAVLVFANLHGAACRECGTEFLEGYEQVAIEDRAGSSFRLAIAGSVTALGGRKLGTYWPKDVQAALGLHARDALRITPLSRDTVVVRVVRDESGSKGPTADV